jgi:signal transduction histidine kinase
MAYSEVTEKLQQSHDQLKATVETLRGELSEKNRLLERKNRLAALGEMAAGMAHEIRNPLGGIQLYASILMKDVSDRPDCCRTIEKMVGGIKRMESVVTQTLQFSREIRTSVCEVDLAHVVAQSIDLAGAECRVEGPETLSVIADPTLLGQATLNLVRNAAEAAGEGGEVTVTYFAALPDSGARQFHLIVRDNGPGIPSDVLDKIFNPFFTTKDSGTGLGLAIVHRIVESHDGTIIVTNPDTGGAKFEIRI